MKLAIGNPGRRRPAPAEPLFESRCVASVKLWILGFFRNFHQKSPMPAKAMKENRGPGPDLRNFFHVPGSGHAADKKVFSIPTKGRLFLRREGSVWQSPCPSWPGHCVFPAHLPGDADIVLRLASGAGGSRRAILRCSSAVKLLRSGRRRFFVSVLTRAGLNTKPPWVRGSESRFIYPR